MSNLVHVAAGVIYNEQGQILIALRPQNAHQGGLWEFPGGKVEAQEDVRAALIRELEEELNITALQVDPLIQVRHDYSDKSVLLDVWTVKRFSGFALGNEGQEIRWVEVSDLADYHFPAANLDIVKAVQP